MRGSLPVSSGTMATDKSVDELLKERARLDAELERYQRLVTVMFTDIAGSTKYFDEQGDLAGMAMVQAVNDTLQPLVKKWKGIIVKTIGDAIMAYWENPVESVRCSIEMQRSLVELNKQRSPSQQIRIRVALNVGIGLLKDNDVFGDVVNVCSRIEHATEATRIGVSPSVVEAVSKEKDIVCRKIGEVTLRGKSQPMDLFEIIWREDEKVEKPQPAKVTNEQLAMATGTRLGLEEDVRAAIAEALKGKGKAGKGLAVEKKKFTLVQVLPDRSLGKRFPIAGETAVVGREKCDIEFDDDPLMSRHHAMFTTLGGALYVEDLNSSNGVFVRIRAPHPLKNDDVILLGRQMFRQRLVPAGGGAESAHKGEAKKDEKKEGKKAETKVEKKPGTVGATGTSTEAIAIQAELVRLLRGGQEEKHFELHRGETTLGRTQGTYSFPDDPYMSRTHARLMIHGARCVLEDLKSTNGTFVRITERHLLDADDTVLVGGQFLRVIAESA